MSRNVTLCRFREQNELHSLSGGYMYRLKQSIGGDDLRDWEIYADMIKRTSQAQALTAQELDLRNFFQHNLVQFWTHPVWKIPEDQCFYVYDFAYHLVQDKKFIDPQPVDSLPLKCHNLWVLECSYTTLKPGAARHFFRKRSLFIDLKFRAAKCRGMSTILLFEALHIPPQNLRNSLPKLDNVDVLFTSVDEFKDWTLNQLDRNSIRSELVPVEDPETTKPAQVQLNGFLKQRKTFKTDSRLHSSVSKLHADRNRNRRKG